MTPARSCSSKGAGLLGRPGSLCSFEGSRDRAVQLRRAVQGSSQRFERVEHNHEAGALAGVVDPYDRAGEFAETRRERHMAIGACAFHKGARIDAGWRDERRRDYCRVGVARVRPEPESARTGATGCGGRAMAPLHTL